ncbi:MAG: prepilin-type N-terminal cleavage/methylation domain-containing protein [Desulfobulbaceae bacterium]|nr:prepilin-type N-terminal cleavage/methylation domain-containing protein [Desulfobulbaceae bacterium]
MNYNTLRQNKGFTLIEVLIAMLISGIVMASIYSAFQSQQNSYLAQDQVTEMQQNIRAGIDFMSREIRMAGYDPLGTSGATILVATSGSLQFTCDITGGESDGLDNDNDGTVDEGADNNGNGVIEGDEFGEFGNGDCTGANENITYGFAAAEDADVNGIADGGGADWSVAANLGRSTDGGIIFQPIAENIMAVEFYYTLDDDTKTLTPGNLARIRSVEITILARAERADPNFVNDQTYVTPSGAIWNPPTSNFRRRLLTTTVQCRNMGL